MEWITLKQLVEKAKVPERTITKRIAKMKSREPELYQAIVDDSVYPRLYKNPQVTEYVKHRSNTLDPRRKKHQKQPTAWHTNRKAKPVSEDTKEKVNRILNEPMQYSMDDEAKQLYDELSTEEERIKFELAVRILEDYKFMQLNLEQACNRHGVSRHQFNRWTYSLAQIERLYHLARLTRTRILEDQEADMHMETLRMASQGYDVHLPVVEYELHRDAYGNEYEIPVAKRVVTKHVARNVAASIFWLTNKRKGEWSRYHEPVPHDATPGGPVDPQLREMSNLSDDELLEMINDTQQRLNQFNDQ